MQALKKGACPADKERTGKNRTRLPREVRVQWPVFR